MKRKLFLYSILVLLATVVLYGCASWGIARLPDKSQLFVSQSTENGFIMAGTLDYPYQPLGYVAVDQVSFTPCGGGNPYKTGYNALEKVMSDRLVQKVKNEMGADGMINVKWTVAPGFLTYVSVTGLAVKRK